MILGGGVRGGRVLGSWPGLEIGRLEGPGDVPVAVNYRDVLAPVLRAHTPDADLGKVFPDFPLAPVELYGCSVAGGLTDERTSRRK
jgi:uncharacterized protein (DUF1501 family)